MSEKLLDHERELLEPEWRGAPSDLKDLEDDEYGEYDEDDLEEEEVEFNPEDVKDQYLTFEIERQHYGVPIAHVEQIISVPEITRIPSYPSYSKGLINLRGSTLPVIDVRLRFGKPQAAYDDRTCTIVCQIEQRRIGLIVERVEEVLHLPAACIQPVPGTEQHAAATFLTGIARDGNRNILLLELDRIYDVRAFGNASM